MSNDVFTMLCVLGFLAYVVAMIMAGGYVAVEKHRHVGEGIAFALLFGPLGLLVVACLPMGDVVVAAPAMPAVRQPSQLGIAPPKLADATEVGARQGSQGSLRR